MSTITKEFTKEQLIAAACSRIDFAKQMLRGNPLHLAKRKWEIELSLSEIALASLEAEHAGFIVKHKVTGKFGSWLHSKADWFRSDEYEVLSAYTAPPAPVSEREPAQMFGIGSVFKPKILSGDEVDCDNCAHYQPNVCHGEGCPAAMLQGGKS